MAMSNRRLVPSIARLDVGRKWLLASALLVALGALLPWYEDVDAFGAGDLYLGVTGPLFLVGLMVFASAAVAAAWVILPALGKRLPALPIKEGALYSFLGVQNLVLLLVANSVFFHPKFGVNITLKNTQFGMILAAIGGVMLVLSGYQLYKKDQERTASIPTEGRLEPLIKLAPETPPVREERKVPVERVEPAAYSGSGMNRYTGRYPGRSAVDLAIDNVNREMGRMAPKEPVTERPVEKAAPQPLRMDL